MPDMLEDRLDWLDNQPEARASLQALFEIALDAADHLDGMHDFRSRTIRMQLRLVVDEVARRVGADPAIVVGMHDAEIPF